jgi:enoyl-CoA hydratase/carnithine racemase
MYQTIKVEWFDKGAIGVLVLNRPERLNSITLPMLLEMQRACAEFTEKRSTCRVVIIQGEGRGFCAGVDLSAVSSSHNIVEQELFSDTLSKLYRLPQPVIALVNGAAGWEIQFLS